MRDLEGAQQALVEQLVRRQAGDVLAVHEHQARGRLVASGDHVEQRGLSRAVRSDKSGDRPGLDLDRSPVNGMESAEMLVQILNDDHAVFPSACPCLRAFRACRGLVFIATARAQGPGPSLSLAGFGDQRKRVVTIAPSVTSISR